MTSKNTRFALLIGAALILFGCEQEPPAKELVRPVRAMKVGDVVELQGRNFPGRAKATQEVDLSFRVAGPLIALPVKVGDKVKEGDLVARIDPRDFEVQQRKAEGELQRAVANEERAESEYNRLLGIQKKDKGLVSEVRVDRAKEDFGIAQADIAAYQASVDAAKDAVGYTHLKAPFDGTIVARGGYPFHPREHRLGCWAPMPFIGNHDEARRGSGSGRPFRRPWGPTAIRRQVSPATNLDGAERD